MQLRRGALHALRLTAAGLLAGMVAGAVAGLGSRLVMYLIRLMNSSHNGEFTHANAEVGRFTLDGTMSLAIEGMFFGVLGAVIYLIVRRWIPGVGVMKGLLFGLILLVVGAPAVLDGNYEYFRYVPTWVAVALFSLLYPLFGVVVTAHRAAGARHSGAAAQSQAGLVGTRDTRGNRAGGAGGQPGYLEKQFRLLFLRHGAVTGFGLARFGPMG